MLLLVRGRRERLEYLVQSLNLSERVGFCGEVPHEQLVWFYNAADVCLFAE